MQQIKNFIGGESDMIKDVLITIFIVIDLLYICQLEKKVDALQSWVEFILDVAIDKFKEEQNDQTHDS